MLKALQGIHWKRLAAFLALYLFFSNLSTIYIDGHNQVTLFWPAAGVTLVFFARYGMQWCIPLTIALLIHAYFNPVPNLFLLFSISANVLGAVSAALYLRYKAPKRFLTMQGGFVMLGAAILMSTTSAMIGVIGLCVSGMASFENFWPNFAKWAMGDLLGAICVAPTLMLFTARTNNNPDLPVDSDYATGRMKIAWVGMMCLAFLLIFFGGMSNSPYALGLASIPIALLVWSAIRFQPIWTLLGVMLTLLGISVMFGFGIAGFKQPDNIVDVAILLGFLCTLALYPLILLVSSNESLMTTKKIIRRATTDNDTGLPNRTAFEESARTALRTIGSARTLAYLDFDHFTLINDTASHAAGDAMIKAISSMLVANLKKGDLLFRIGGDEFAFLFLCEGREAELRAQQVLRSIESFRTGWDTHILSTTASIGLATLWPEKSDFDQLLSQADAACFTAKERGGNRICKSDLELSALQVQTDSMHWAVRIREALNAKRFEIDCQEIKLLSAKAGSGRYFEVLLRMRDPLTGARLLPDLFIPSAERFNLATKIDRHVIDLLLSWMESHPDAANTVVACSINLSAASMVDETFSNFLRNRLNGSSFLASKIIFEVTETSAMLDLSRAQTLIADLRRIGCRFALDDFGTGFCSFKYLQNLDVDIFKIDGSFVSDLQTSPLSKAVIRSITDIAHVLKKTTIAEHCESDAVAELLRELGVDQAQGFGIHKPQPIAEYFSDGQ